MSYLRGNFRKKAIDIDYTGIGGGLANWIQGSAVVPDFKFGGFVFGSAATVSASAYVVLSAGDALNQAYGVTYVSNVLNGGSGFKYIPVAFQDFTTAPAGIFYRLSATGAFAGDDSIVVIAVQSGGGTNGSGAAGSAAFSGAVHFLHFGFIVSTPFAFK